MKTNQLKDQKKSILMMVLVLSFLLVLLLFVYMIGTHYNIPFAYLTRDPASLCKTYPFIGILSNLGILFWSAAAAITFVGAMILSKNNKKFANFLLFSGLFTSLLLLDDLFMFHEEIFPKVLEIPQNTVLASYFILSLIYLAKFKDEIFQTDYFIFFLALFFFFLSLLCDLFLPYSNIEYLIEDGFKLIGIVTWFVFFARTLFIEVQNLISSHHN
ncbi:MAG: hypothetical protein ABXS92_05165 [Sulfurimonas sp.]